MEIVCRLCLIEFKDHFEVIDNVAKEILNVLLLGMDVDISENLVMCGSCAESINKFFHFKSMFLSIEQCILSFAVDKQEANFELRDIIEDDLDLKTLCGGFNICRFCMKQLERSNVASMDILINEVMDMLPVFVPEMNINIIQDAVICLVCKENLESYIMFVKNYLDLEGKKDGFCQNKPINNTCRPSRHNILQYFLPKPTQISSTKQEAVKTMHSGVCALLFKCALCAFETKQKRSLKSHMIKHKAKSEGELHKCTICAFETRYKRNFKRHMLQHRGVLDTELFKCTSCSYETKYKGNLKSHVIRHNNTSEIKLLKCTVCGFETKYKSALKIHTLKHKNVSELVMYKCTLCAYETKYSHYLKSHMLKHKDISEVESFKCALCAYETKYKKHLKTHMITHKDISEVELHKCTICSYETIHSSYIKSHMLKHKDISEVKSFKCMLCAYQTKYKQGIKTHMITHTDISEAKWYKCTICSYKTRYKHIFNCHMLGH